MGSRVLCWFSCGITSAVAAKMAVEEHQGRDLEICYCVTNSEHPDNVRFLKDCEEWIGLPIKSLESEEYNDIWDVFKKTGWLVGPRGARCTTELKKRVRVAYQRPDDVHVFGLDAGEIARATRFRSNNHDLRIETPLIEKGLTKEDCARVVARAGIRVPEMYRLGYSNNNCVGCVKGQMGYWNKIRVDFPDVFSRMAGVERELDVAICKSYAGDGKRKRVFLDELDPDEGRFSSQPDFSCGVGCEEQLSLGLGGEDG